MSTADFSGQFQPSSVRPLCYESDYLSRVHTRLEEMKMRKPLPKKIFKSTTSMPKPDLFTKSQQVLPGQREPRYKGEKRKSYKQILQESQFLKSQPISVNIDLRQHQEVQSDGTKTPPTSVLNRGSKFRLYSNENSRLEDYSFVPPHLQVHTKPSAWKNPTPRNNQEKDAPG
jgi:hypothetical protein